jgi:hypothetical protein
VKALGIALVIVGYALFYSGASNLFTGGQGWGFLQALLNKGTANQSGSIPNDLGGSKGDSGKSSDSGGLSGLWGTITNPFGAL